MDSEPGDHEAVETPEQGAHEEQQRRRESAIFWEERNLFFSDVWTDIRGTVQTLKRSGTRDRSGAFPFELALRLILMYAIKGDTVLDPFWGTGTTALAAEANNIHKVSHVREKMTEFASAAELAFAAGTAAFRPSRRRGCPAGGFP